MKIQEEIVVINKKKIPIRICGNENSKYIFILNHGVLSKKESFRPFEKIGINKYIFVSFDARGNEGSLLKPSRYTFKYVNDLRDIVLWIKSIYPKKEIVIIGSSWGAAIALEFAKKYNSLVYKIIGWSIPHKTFGSDDYNMGLQNVKDKKNSSSILFILWSFLVMLITNINTHIKIKIDYRKTTSNKILIRMGKMKKYDLASTRYIWAVWKSLISSIKKIKILNKKSKIKILYIQSMHDSYGDSKTYKFLKENTGNNVDYLLVNEFFHAVHWERANQLDIRIFNMISNWIEKDELYLEKSSTLATHTNKSIMFSFIIAAYNVEKYIQKCIESILTNDDGNYEIIIVEDCSTDNTLKILEKYKDIPKIKIIKHQNNKGLPWTRNDGVNAANGEWYIFVDGDDFISPNFINSIKHHLDNTHNFYIYRIEKDDMANKYDLKIQSNKMNDSIVSRVINNSLFDDYTFPIKYHHAIEDWDFYLYKWGSFRTKNICADKNIWYHYTYNPNSLTKSPTVYRSRLMHAIYIYDNPDTRKTALLFKIYGHSYLHLLLMSKLWFPDLIHDVKKIKYRQKNSWLIKIQYWILLLPFIKKKIKRIRKAIND